MQERAHIVEVAQRARELELEEDEHLKNLEGELENLRRSVGQQRKQSSIFETDADRAAAAADDERERHSCNQPTSNADAHGGSQRSMDRTRSSSAYNIRELLTGGGGGERGGGGDGGGGMRRGESPESLSLDSRGSLGGTRLGKSARAASRLPTCGLCWRIPTLTHPSCARIAIPCILIEGQFDPVLHSELDLNVEQQIARLQTLLLPCKMCGRRVCKDCRLVHSADSEQLVRALSLLCCLFCRRTPALCNTQAEFSCSRLTRSWKLLGYEPCYLSLLKQ